MRLPRLLASLCLALVGCQDLGPPPEAAEDRAETLVSPEDDETLCDDAPFRPFAPPVALLHDTGGCDAADEPYCFALAPDLRDVAAARDPMTALSESAQAFADEDDVRGRAFADLAVSGAAAFEAFAELEPQLDDLPAELPREAREAAVERAYAVAWALRGPVAHRRDARPELEHIAVSGEDDPPGRPVNIPIGAFPQTDLTVPVALGDGLVLSLRTRVLVASTDEVPEPELPDSLTDAAPPTLAPVVPDGPVLVFVHGHSSLAEEGAALSAELVARAAEQDRSLTVVMFDLPSNAYASRVDPQMVIDAADGADDALLRFHDAFVESVVETLGVEAQVAAVIGGSLGGNLVLRLGQRDVPWARRLVAWSPASVDFSWERARWIGSGDQFSDVVKHEAVRITRESAEQTEEPDSRRDYFVGGLSSVRNQAHYWYRDGWDCKDAMIHEGLLQLSEIYDDRFRRWHYRVAYEQLAFSHLEPDEDGTRPYERIRAPLLLVAGDEDNGVPMQTRFFVERLAEQLTMPGETLVLEDTGHALHSERPGLLAERILDHLD